jgi:peptide methionine sulfoxide reductase MsrB
MHKLKNDKYKRSRGTSQALDISCKQCGEHVAYYQKDGPGSLKRMYLDRFIDIQPTGDELRCRACNQLLGHKINYKREDRPAYRLFEGTINKRKSDQKELP